MAQESIDLSFHHWNGTMVVAREEKWQQSGCGDSSKKNMRQVFYSLPPPTLPMSLSWLSLAVSEVFEMVALPLLSEFQCKSLLDRRDFSATKMSKNLILYLDLSEVT